jgi:pimeloyl-ACP methyl ester carboxylesterase
MIAFVWFLALCSVNLLLQTSAQEPLIPQNNTFNSFYSLAVPESSIANLTALDIQDIEVALNFERSNWATGSVFTDPFYSDLPSNASNAEPGSLLKLDLTVNTTWYTLPPATALSRIVFMSENANGTAVPASAYILWPYLSGSYDNRTTAVIGWAHGSSGMFAECAPSHIRNLWYQFSAPYVMALEGYAVVGVDYAGLGVHSTSSGQNITNQAQLNAAAANDLFYAIEAAQSAFPKLSKSFVIAGHSVGGGAAWAAAERQVLRPVSGYLGAVAGSPVTNSTAVAIALQAVPYSGITIADSITSVFPDFNKSVILTEAGSNYITLARDLQGCNSVLLEILDAALVSNNSILSPPDWVSDPTVKAWQDIAAVGGKDVAGSLLILQGVSDTTVPEVTTTAAVNKTKQAFPDASIEYLRFEGVDHVR